MNFYKTNAQLLKELSGIINNYIFLFTFVCQSNDQANYPSLGSLKAIEAQFDEEDEEDEEDEDEDSSHEKLKLQLQAELHRLVSHTHCIFPPLYNVS